MAHKPCLYYHPERDLRTFLLEDDFATVVTRGLVVWFGAAPENRFDIETQCVSHGAIGIPGCRLLGGSTAPAPTATNGETRIKGAEARLLNRVIKCTQKGRLGGSNRTSAVHT